MPDAVRESLLPSGWRDLPFEPFRHGVEIHWIRAFEAEQPGVALLKYQPGASVPRHRHEGLETILILDGVQSDETGDYEQGSLIINDIGSIHSVWSEHGCVVLIQWDQPVTILDEDMA